MPTLRSLILVAIALLPSASASIVLGDEPKHSPEDIAFYERKIRPVLVEHCYECHSESAGEQQGGLLLDREAGWIEGGETNKAIIPGEPEASLLIAAVSYEQDELLMPPEGKLDDETIQLLTKWVRRGAPGAADDMGETEFSRLGDQEYIFEKAANHWAFKPVESPKPPKARRPLWNKSPVDQFVDAKLAELNMQSSARARLPELYRRLSFDLTGLPPDYHALQTFLAEAAIDRQQAIEKYVDQLLDSPAYGQHIGRMWLDVARYADTDSAYRPDTKSPYYFPFAFTYRDYVVDAFNGDKPYGQFVKEQFAADKIGFKQDDPEIAAIGFLGIAPHSQRAPQEALDDWIDVTTRGLMGITVACARCHDHKYEPIPTADYYSLRGVFSTISRPNPLNERAQPLLVSYQPTESQVADYEAKRAVIDQEIADLEGKKSKNNKRSLAARVRDTKLAELLTFHPGAPARSMIITDAKKPPKAFIYIRGDSAARGEQVPLRFLRILEPKQPEFPKGESSRLALAEKIADTTNPLTYRVYVNRIWGHVMGSHLVDTPSDFGLQGKPPTHPELLDYLTKDFLDHGQSTKRLMRMIVLSEAYAQSSQVDAARDELDHENQWLWRANRRHLSIEALRDSVLCVADRLDRSLGGRAAPLWGDDYTRRRTIYGFINRFNLDPTLRAFDFPAPMQTQPKRGESIVAPQALFLMNSAFVVDQANAIASSQQFNDCVTDADRVDVLFQRIFQRSPANTEVIRIGKFLESQRILAAKVNPSPRFNLDPWPMVAQAMMMSNEFQYVD